MKKAQIAIKLLIVMGAAIAVALLIARWDVPPIAGGLVFLGLLILPRLLRDSISITHTSRNNLTLTSAIVRVEDEAAFVRLLRGMRLRKSLDEPLDETIKRLPLGHMAVNVADRMRAHQRERLTVAIGKAEKQLVIDAVGEARGEILTDEIKVGSLMRVEVTGDAFDIEAPERVDKVVVEGEAAVWDYWVTPKRRGKQALTIRGIVRIRLQPSGDQEYYELPVVTRQVHVQVNAAHTLRQCGGFIFSKLFAAVVAVWGLAIAVFAYLVKLDAVKSWISGVIKPFLPGGH